MEMADIDVPAVILVAANPIQETTED